MEAAADIPETPSLFRHRSFLLLWLGRIFSSAAYQMGSVAIGWQVYALTHSAFDLGMVGLVQFVPVLVLTFAAGHAVDRYSRKTVLQYCQAVEALVAVYLAWGSFGGWITVTDIFIAAGLLGAARTFGSPASTAMLPGVVPSILLQRATALSSAAFQAATIMGPALGGILYAFGAAIPYGVMAALWLLACISNGMIVLDRPLTVREAPSLRAVFAGVAFVRSNKAILGTISLDLFAVLLGGATALLPIYAGAILHSGPFGLGLLRGASAAGALLMTVLLARHTIDRRVGMRMFQAVILFGIATVVFALSRSFAVSLGALFVMGAADMISVVIRITLVQLATPDGMRGRVNAVNFLFINASNELGEFESGTTAALIGAVPAAVLGGIGTIIVALLWMKLFPTLRDMDRMPEVSE